MSVCPLTPEDLLKIEVELCKELLLKMNYFPGEKFTLIQDKRHLLETFTRKPHENPLKLVICFEVDDPRNRDASWWVHLGAQLEQSGGDRSATYMMAVGTKVDGELFGHVSDTLCKVHWDYEFRGTPKGERKPERHMQFGGRIHAELTDYGYKAFWTEGMDKPRIPNFPVCFVTLIHWAFLEFAHCDHIETVLKSSWWTKLVRNAEEKTLKPYFEGALNFFGKAVDNDKSFLSHGYR